MTVISNASMVNLAEGVGGEADTDSIAPLTDGQREIAALLWQAGLVRVVFRSLRLSLSQHDELIGEMGLWLCYFVQRYATQARDIRALAFVFLRSRCLSWLRKNNRRNLKLGKRVDEQTIPQCRYCPDTSLFCDDPEAVRIILSARHSAPGRFTRKQAEISRVRLARLKNQYTRRD